MIGQAYLIFGGDFLKRYEKSFIANHRCSLIRKISRQEFRDIDTRTKVVKDKTKYNRKKKHPNRDYQLTTNYIYIIINHN